MADAYTMLRMMPAVAIIMSKTASVQAVTRRNISLALSLFVWIFFFSVFLYSVTLSCVKLKIDTVACSCPYLECIGDAFRQVADCFT